ncbi:MAG: hypothetical protein ABI165_10545 [Bryobacteraceae bacterium]
MEFQLETALASVDLPELQRSPMTGIPGIGVVETPLPVRSTPGTTVVTGRQLCVDERDI